MQATQKKNGNDQMIGNITLSLLVAAILAPSIIKDSKEGLQKKAAVQELSVKKTSQWMWNHGK